MLTHMQMSGFLDRIAGAAFGSFEDCGNPEEFLRIIQDRFKHAPYPVLTGMPFGHGKRNLTLPVGLEATLGTDRGCLTYNAPATIYRPSPVACI
jgi:muramoyltetrapeptide carboxypeptidase